MKRSNKILVQLLVKMFRSAQASYDARTYAEMKWAHLVTDKLNISLKQRDDMEQALESLLNEPEGE